MDRAFYKKNCEKIEKSVGESFFKSEKFLDTLQTSQVHKKLKELHEAHAYSVGGFISGEIMLTITLHLLSGASYVDLGLLYVCGYSSTCRTFHHVINNWICNDKAVAINYYDNLTNIEKYGKPQNPFLPTLAIWAYLVASLAS